MTELSLDQLLAEADQVLHEAELVTQKTSAEIAEIDLAFEQERRELNAEERREVEKRCQKAWKALPASSVLYQSDFGRGKWHILASSRNGGGGGSLRTYLEEISSIPRITPEEERALGYKAQLGNESALWLLIETNLRFVVSRAKRYRGLGISFLDLIGEGNLGLIEAARRFDPDKKVKFTTYAVWWIENCIMHAISEQGRLVRLPKKKAELLRQMKAAQANLRQRLQRQPSETEIAELLNWDAGKIRRLAQVANNHIQLEANIDEEHEFSLFDKLKDESTPYPDDAFAAREIAQLVQDSLHALSEKESRVIALRFGLVEDGEPRTLEEVGESMGLSRERVRQIENEALGKLRHDRTMQQLRASL